MCSLCLIPDAANKNVNQIHTQLHLSSAWNQSYDQKGISQGTGCISYKIRTKHVVSGVGESMTVGQHVCLCASSEVLRYKNPK